MQLAKQVQYEVNSKIAQLFGNLKKSQKIFKNKQKSLFYYWNED